MQFRKPKADDTVDFRKPRINITGPLSVVAIVIAALILLSNTFYKVGEQEQAVITMFGQVQGIKSAGLYAKIPFAQQVHRVDTTTHGMPIGYTIDGNAQSGEESPATTTVADESTMITSDFNFVNIDFYLEYRVSDPVKYLYASSDPDTVLKNEAQASIRSTVVNYKVDDVITTGKSQIQADVKEKLIAALAENDIGIQVVNVSVQDAEPPTDEVLQAFKAVETAKQGAQTAANNANQYKNEKIPAAEASADQITQTAEAKKEARIAEAQGQVERFNQMYAEYTKYPLITKQRMFYETMEDVLPDLKVIITDGKTQTMYPLDSFSGQMQDTTGTQDAASGSTAAAETETSN